MRRRARKTLVRPQRAARHAGRSAATCARRRKPRFLAACSSGAGQVISAGLVGFWGAFSCGHLDAERPAPRCRPLEPGDRPLPQPLELLVGSRPHKVGVLGPHRLGIVVGQQRGMLVSPPRRRSSHWANAACRRARLGFGTFRFFLQDGTDPAIGHSDVPTRAGDAVQEAVEVKALRTPSHLCYAKADQDSGETLQNTANGRCRA